ATASIICRVASSPSPARRWASAGTKACAKAPSPNSRRSRFGMRKATRKASYGAPAPKTEATNTSRASPVIREASVNSEMVDAARRRFMDPDAILAVFAEKPLYSSTRPHTMATASQAKKKKTVRIASGLKRARQDVKLNAANTAMRSHFRTVVKNVQKAIDSGDKAKAAELFKTAQPVIDSVADKGLFHKNKAARHKSRLAAKVKALATAAA